MLKRIYTSPLFWVAVSVIFIVVKFLTLQSRILDSITIAGQIYLLGFNLCKYLEGTNYNYDEKNSGYKRAFQFMVFFQAIVGISLVGQLVS